MRVHFTPPSWLRYKAFFSLFSTNAYTTLGCVRETAKPMRPRSPAGRPSLSVRFTQVSPPSWVMYMPLPGPPLLNTHGQRRYSHIAANNLLGFCGSRIKSAAPLRLLVYSTFFHVFPPSCVRYTPRSSVSP